MIEMLLLHTDEPQMNATLRRAFQHEHIPRRQTHRLGRCRSVEDRRRRRRRRARLSKREHRIQVRGLPFVFTQSGIINPFPAHALPPQRVRRTLTSLYFTRFRHRPALVFVFVPRSEFPVNELVKVSPLHQL